MNLSNYNFVKRVPVHPKSNKNDIYVCSKNSINSLMKRAIKLFDSGVFQIKIHALGYSINKAIEFALLLQEKYLNNLEVSPTTSSEELFDEYQPIEDGLEPISQTRVNSSIHILITRKKD
ncbi:ribonuclease p protein subunit p20 [Anaeramoeba ignava]|uniref:Ribonuclease P protein subunit p20 n=1 Tax=Anaeramoeba ignava TaxID=1746090 RepID=A0A9Q0LMP3_ANAIG|nr:ribonuclease p protein subunit p20 [Anaeramoeba ignava]